MTTQNFYGEKNFITFKTCRYLKKKLSDYLKTVLIIIINIALIIVK